jgi:hypothetical protein
MNAIANARQSALVARMTQHQPVLRVSDMNSDTRFVSFLLQKANDPRSASHVVKELENFGRQYRLDSTLSDILRAARATVKRQQRFH